MEEGGLPITQALVHQLLNRVKEFNEWGQCVVLDVVADYKPETDVRHASAWGRQLGARPCGSLPRARASG